MSRESFNEIISDSHTVYKPEPNRYWIYGALGCPFSHRVMIARSIKGLNNIIGLTIAHWLMGPKGWQFIQNDDPDVIGDAAYRYDGGITSTENDNSSSFVGIDESTERLFIDGTSDPHYNIRSIRELYRMSEPDYAGAFSVPVLWDLKTMTIVNNDSGQIIRMLNSGIFDKFLETDDLLHTSNIDLSPIDLIPTIDDYNKWLQVNVNSGVYKVNNASTQADFEEQSQSLYNALDNIEDKLEKIYDELKSFSNDDKDYILQHFYLFANQITECDIRLFTTIIRFDSIYVQHFGCNWKTIRDNYPYISLWLQNLYWNEKSFRWTTNFDHIKLFYAKSFKKKNITGIVPIGPKYDILPL